MLVIVYCLLLINSLSFLVHLSVLPKRGVVVGIAALLAVYTYGFYSTAIQQSNQRIAYFLHDRTTIQGLSILWVGEGALLLIISLLNLAYYFGESIKKWYRYSLYLVAPSIFLTVSLGEITLFLQGFALPFATLTILFALSMVGLCLLLSTAIRWVLPETDLRLELKLILHLVQIIMACLLTVRFDVQTVHVDVQMIHYKPFGVTVLLFLLVSSLGYVGYQRRIKSKKWIV